MTQQCSQILGFFDVVLIDWSNVPFMELNCPSHEVELPFEKFLSRFTRSLMNNGSLHLQVGVASFFELAQEYENTQDMDKLQRHFDEANAMARCSRRMYWLACGLGCRPEFPTTPFPLNSRRTEGSIPFHFLLRRLCSDAPLRSLMFR